MQTLRMSKSVFFLASKLMLVIALLLSAVSPAAATPPAQTFGGDPLNAFPLLFPELLTMPAPAWVREGQRISYYVQSATIAQQEGEEGASGAGYLQHDIVALDGAFAVVASSLYLNTGAGVTPAGVFGASFLPGVSDFWLNPAVLKHAEDVANDELVVVHMPTTIAEQEYDAVRFEYHTEDGVTISMFDTETGLLVYFRHTVGADAAATRQSSEIYLLGRRQLRIPWRGTKAPTWVKQGAMLEYEGTRSVFVAGSPSGQFAESASASIKLAQGRWSAFRLTSFLGGAVTGASDRVTGANQVADALWLPVEALKNSVRAGTLDRDPVTGVTIAYVRNADRSITIRGEGSLFRIDNTYDRRTGKLITARVEVQTGLAVQVTELYLVN
ncbi:MAG: hypothetical protein WAU00_14695 [Caldilinea sp.]